MSRTLLAGLALIGLAACGGGRKQRPAMAKTTSHATARPTAARSTKSKTAKPKSQRRGARADTTTARNPLTNH
jgi:hypothetical protein